MKPCMLIRISLMMILLLTGVQAMSQRKSFTLIDLNQLWQQHKLRLVNRSATVILSAIEEHQGLRLDERPGMGAGWVDDVNFSNGTITVDIKGKDVLQQSFVGIAFHGTNDSTFDAIYFRPFNFKSADSVRRSHSVQYISYPNYDWELLRNTYPGKYEHAVTPAPDPNAYFHVRIVVKYPMVKVYVNNNPTPCLEVRQLSKQKKGKLAVWTGNNAGGDFANLMIQPSK